MVEHFITKINIKKVRHLENIQINLSNNEKKHLILTGKNGSGKTSVLEALMRFLKGIENGEINRFDNYDNELQSLNKQLEEAEDNYDSYDTLKEIRRVEDYYNYYIKNLSAELLDIKNISKKYMEGRFILSYFDAKRNPSIQIPNSVPKVQLSNNYKIDENIANMFLNYLVYLKTQQSFARNENDENVVNKIQKWFDNLENALKDLFEDESIKLIFDYKNLNFKIRQDNREDYGFDALSDGYSAILDIIMNLILRMEKEKRKNYDVEGIVIIDEVETHLHIELQKKIMPFLIAFFPNIQFIISTHSPFVLSSLDNAVIYDLEKRIKVEDLSGYAYDGIVESYFDIDKYSSSIKEKIEEYEKLILKEKKTEDEILQVAKLRKYFNTIPKELAPELVYKFNNIELFRKTKQRQKESRVNRYDNILNPIKEDEDVENFIKYEMPIFPKSKVRLTALNKSEKTLQTVCLLNDVYNGTTPLKIIESEYIREELLKELLDLQEALLIYYGDEYEEVEIKSAKKKIIRHLNKNSAFTAFKRWIIKDNNIFYEDFKEFLKL